ncbi:MAG: hypothetical protein GY896_09630 [Gammaproteobacteria bacterium]|nr:hypothetical protein [Gammaproteobacteria bacterium]
MIKKQGIQIINAKVSSILCGAGFALLTSLAQAVSVTSFNTGFTASQSVFKDGASAGFDESGSTGGAIGISYSAKANAGTVKANVNGQLQATYDETIKPPGSTTVSLKYNGGSSSVSSKLGASANLSGFLNVCVIPNIFTGAVLRASRKVLHCSTKAFF